MLSKSQISLVASLQQKKFRKREGLFVAEGEKVVEELLASSWKIKKIFSVESFFHRHASKKKNSSIDWLEVSESELSKISLLTTPNKVLALAEIPVRQVEEKDFSHSLSLVLDDISDPGNLGTIIRIADWFGIENIVCSMDTADCYNPKVVQASMGSLFRVSLHYADLLNFLEQNERSGKTNVYGTTLNGKSIYETSLTPLGIIVVGSEANGINKNLEKYFSHSISIPSFSSGDKNQWPDSLNAAVATAIVCAEFRRRQE